MVGLVIISHSRNLAEAACRLATNVGQGELPIAFAGGAGDDHQELGTDATDIMEAIQKVSYGDGVLLLMDLGSAVLSAKMAAEMLADEVPDIVLCPAPLVEGAVAAAVQIGVGADIATVCNEARKALEAKNREVGEDAPDPDGQPPADAPPPTDALIFRFTMDDPNGMHTRPAAEFVKAVATYKCEVRIRNPLDGGPFVNGRSLNQIALSNIRRGDISEVALWGPQAAEALAALRKLVADVYHGREIDQLPPAPVPPATAAAEVDTPAGLTRLAAGIAVGTLFVADGAVAKPTPMTISDPEAEIARLDAAVAAVHQSLSARSAAMGPEMETGAAILDAQLLILDDGEILDSVRATIRERSVDAASAYQQRMAQLADGYRALSSPYMKERAADVGGVAGQVLEALAGKKPVDVSQLREVVVWAEEATPALLTRWGKGQLVGILTRDGGVTSHVAILAKAMNIPAIMGYTPPAEAKTGDRVAMDANHPEVVVDPSEEEAEAFAARRRDWLASLARDLADSAGPAATRDGVTVPIYANVGDALTVEAAVRHHAEGVGLLRTEFLFLDRRLPPDEDEQARSLAALLEPLATLPLVVRTLDAGGDKPMPWLNLPRENNPFLGVRGVRLVLAHPDLFKRQLRSILKAGSLAGAVNLGVMIPMIATLDEIARARSALAEAHDELARENAPHSWPVRFGIMVETPAAVMQAEKMAAEVDFFSIGTNDLTQYIMCAERGSKELVGLSDAMHPAVLAGIGLVAAGAARHGTEVAVCGEMAGDPAAALALIGLGVHHLSMNAPAIGKVKRAIRQAKAADLAEAARQALTMTSAEEVRELYREFLTCCNARQSPASG